LDLYHDQGIASALDSLLDDPIDIRCVLRRLVRGGVPLISIFFLPDTLANQAASQSFTFSVVQGTNHQGDYTMLVAAAIVQAGTITWCWWYNWRKIKSWHIGGQRNCIADTVE
jgi:hypothetical protein